ncbi:hypothetical protein BDF14DRAFT_1761388 [Spinellus fusiger]|nr:hypothetical protein BDF14DRAFT_1761388 [Spinellus fusiger]
MFSRYCLSPRTGRSLTLLRSYWTSVTGTGPTLEACLDSCVQQAQLKRGASAAMVFVSKSFDSDDYDKLSHLIQQRLSTKWLVGLVVDRVPHFDHGVSLYVGYDEHVVGFQVKDGPERNKVRSVSVGRWGRPEYLGRVAYQQQQMESMGWDGFESVSTPTQDYVLPETLTTRQTPSFVFLASDNEPDELLKTLDHHYPATLKLGIVGASTPFVNGNPYTLFYQDQLMGAGIAGFATYTTKSEALSYIKIEHPSLLPIGKPMHITRCRGNIILDLDQAGATGLLLELIKNKQNSLISKDETFYLGIYPPEDTTMEPSKMTVCRVTSGDPSRGNMSVDTTVDLQEGQVVQFMRKKGVTTTTSDNSMDVAECGVFFGVVDKEKTIDLFPVTIPAQAEALVDRAGGASENGVILGRPNLASQILDVPSSNVSLSFSNNNK